MEVFIELILGNRAGVWVRPRRLASGAVTCTGKGWHRSRRTESSEDVWSLQCVPLAQLSGDHIEVQPMDGLAVAVAATSLAENNKTTSFVPSSHFRPSSTGVDDSEEPDPEEQGLLFSLPIYSAIHVVRLSTSFYT